MDNALSGETVKKHLSGRREQPTDNIPPNLTKTEVMTSIRKGQETESKALVISNLKRRLTFF
jgi:hypothetical protein